jgi:hypothetical protein
VCGYFIFALAFEAHGRELSGEKKTPETQTRPPAFVLLNEWSIR